MPVFKYGNELNLGKCEVKKIDIIYMGMHENFNIHNQMKKEAIFVGEGKVTLKTKLDEIELKKNEHREFSNGENSLDQIIANENSIVLSIAGNWKNHHGSRGVFELTRCNYPKNIGDAVNYMRNTEFDNHFHDCDEFWILFEGSGEVVTEGKRYLVKAGDCVFTKAGDHHDFPIVNNTIKAVWFETSFIGKKREGHLWNHTHKVSAI